jgi:hypothetical protein
LGCLALLTGLFVIGLVRPHIPPLFGTRPELSDGEVDSIEIEILPVFSRMVNEPPDVQQFTIPNGTISESLLIAFRNAHAGDEHRCAEIGKIEIHYRDGNTDILDILPGHSPAAYEFRYAGGLYRMSRRRFLQAMEAGGIDPSLLVSRDRD